MNKRHGNVEVVTEVGFCNFCGRTRNLRREEHRLGDLMRAIVSCETCHRTLTNTIGVAPPEPAPQPVEEEAPASEPAAEAKAPAKQEPARPTPARRATKAAATGAPAPKPKSAPKSRSTATRQSSKKKA